MAVPDPANRPDPQGHFYVREFSRGKTSFQQVFRCQRGFRVANCLRANLCNGNFSFYALGHICVINAFILFIFIHDTLIIYIYELLYVKFTLIFNAE